MSVQQVYDDDYDKTHNPSRYFLLQSQIAADRFFAKAVSIFLQRN
jgi:hypothetical protein